MEIEEIEPRARHLIGQAADLVHAVAYPGDEVGRSSPDAAILDPAIRDLNELEDLLGPGIGPANTDEGLPKLRDAVRKMEGLVMSSGQPVFLSEDARLALREAARLLKRVEQLLT